MEENKTQAQIQILEPHEYDGIVEEQNQLPRWWLATFYLTAIFALGYFVYYQFGPGTSNRKEFELAMQAHEKQFASQAGAAGLSDNELETLAKRPEALAKGKAIFVQRCVVCHGAQGEGKIGPNLTDNYWIHGDGKPLAIATVVKEGVPAKGMPPWGQVLSFEDVKQVAVFVRSLHGTHPANPKAPQGELRND